MNASYGRESFYSWHYGWEDHQLNSSQGGHLNSYNVFKILFPIHVNMNELGGELAKPAGFDSGRLPAHYPRMMFL
jgi:hypothetical protein